MEDTTQYKCPSCGGTLEFNPKKGNLLCPFCDSEYDLETAKTFQKAGETQEQSSTGTDSNAGFDWGKFKKFNFDDNGTLDDMNVYVCQSCGAAIETDQQTAAMACPYCGNNVILDSKLEGSLRPNAIIPFRITPETLPAAVRAFYKKKILLPKGFFSENQIGKVQGVYVPFWLYDCHVDGRVTLNATRVRHYRQGQYDCTETSFFLLERDGEMAFSKIPVDASTRMDNDLMDSIEPFDYSGLTAFEKPYLTGYLAERFDTDPDQELPRADRRMRQSTADAFKKTAGGYTTVSIKENNMRADQVAVKYVLLPVYLLNCTYNGKTYRYAVNGQTGKVVGELPISKKRQAAWFFGVAAAVFAAVFPLLSLL